MPRRERRPGYLLERLRAGVPEAALLPRGTGTRPAEKEVAGRRTLTFRTLCHDGVRARAWSGAM